MKYSRKDIRPFFRPVYFKRGLDYFERGMVIKSNLSSDGQWITSTVKGSGRQAYKTRIHLIFKQGLLLNVQGHCSCPVDYNCKHVVASLLHNIDSRPLEQDDLFGLPSDKWLYQLKAAKPQQVSSRPTSELLLYILQTNADSSGTQLYVDTVKTRLKKNGEYAESSYYSGKPESRAGYIKEDDKFALLLLESLKPEQGFTKPVLTGESGFKALNVLIDTGRCHWKNENNPAIKHAEPLQSDLGWQLEQDASQVIRAHNLDEKFVLIALTPPCYLNLETAECGVLESGLPEHLASVLLSSPKVKPEEVDKVVKVMKQLGKGLNIPLPVKPVLNKIKKCKPIPCLQLVNEKIENPYSVDSETYGIALLSFNYADHSIHPFSAQDTLTVKTENGFDVIRRDKKFETEALDSLDELGLSPDEYIFELGESLQLEPVDDSDTWIDFMLYHRDQLELEGWKIDVADDFTLQIDEADDWYANINESSNEWFKLELGIEVDGKPINLLPFLVNYLGSLKTAQAMSELQQLPDDYPLLLKQNNGHLLRIPLIKVRHIIDTLIELYDPAVLDQDGKLELSRYHSSQLVELGNTTKMTWAGGETLRKFGEQLQSFEGIREVKPPSTLKAELRDYQKDGLSWLQFLRKYQLGGILADDMGLGKTVQTLAHLLVEKKSKRADLPSLVVAPTSLMINWSREAARFAPSLKVLILQGVDRKNKFHQIQDHDLVLTTYPLLSRDTKILMHQEWHYIILDEAQHIKNAKSKAAQTARQLKTRYRLCLTGTPMENHLGELWSQFHFLMPGMLGNEKRFRRIFRNPIEKNQDIIRQQQLRKRTAPFMLRRHKSEVATELPPKTEIFSEVELDGAQRDLYETIRVSMHNKVRLAIDSSGIARSQIIILDALLKLRQVCCHPHLLSLPSAKKVKHSAKLSQLMEMVPEMVEEGRRILLFSQFTSMLAIIEDELIKHKIDYVKLTGQTRNREIPIDKFQSGKVPVFLISLKAGGSGLNLTAADTVIHYDPWWNPAAENQATDRAHRIGQDKPVFVYKMITAGTVEEKIVEMQEKKQALADSLFAEGSKGSAITSEDLQALFEPLS